MRIFGRVILGLVTLVMVISCAQVGTITGGERDRVAPKPLAEEINPENGLTNSRPTRIVIPFDEFIQLQNASANITISPSTLKIKSALKKKSLIMDLSGEYLDNTTYSITLNNAVKDITEGNDSLMTYVFSTGDFLDSLTATFKVVDAESNKPLEKFTVGLFTEESDIDTSYTAIYLRESDKKGNVSFSYLKNENYYVYAFEDLNRNGRVDASEKSGRLSKIMDLNVLDSILPIIKVSAQKQVLAVTDELLFGTIWKIAFNQKIDTAKFETISEEIIKTKWNNSLDTVSCFVALDSESGELLAKYIKEDGTEKSISKRFLNIEKSKLDVTSNLLKRNKLPYNQQLKLSFNDLLKSYGYVGILVNNKSLALKHGKILKIANNNELEINLGVITDTTTITILPNTLRFANLEQTDTLEYTLVAQQLKEVGTIKVLVKDGFPDGILQLISQTGELIKKEVIAGEEEVNFINLQPGIYKYSFIYDEDKNGEWSAGNTLINLQPEKKIIFSEATKVRPNWDVEAELLFED